jgi:hypothetical protein
MLEEKIIAEYEKLMPNLETSDSPYPTADLKA